MQSQPAAAPLAGSRGPRRRLLVVLLAAQTLGLAATGLSSFGRYADHHAVDFQVYSETARRVLRGQIPYRDFDLEYPPLAVVPFTLPRLLMIAGSDSATVYRGLFLVVMLLCSAAVVWALARSCALVADCQQPGQPLFIYALGVTLLGPFLAWRFDLFPASLTGLALLAFLRSHAFAAGGLLGLGVAAKLYPVVLIPIFLAEALARRDYRSARSIGLGACAALAVVVLPFAAISARGLGRMVAYHADRGLEVGSIPSGLGLLADKLGLTQASIEFRFGGVQTVFPWSETALRLLPILTAIALCTVVLLAYLRFRRDVESSRTTGAALVAYLTLSLLAFTITSKVLSPQYIAWLLPFFPLLPVRHAVWLLIACALTTAVFPWQFVALLEQKDQAVVLLNARNALLVAGGVWLLRDYAPAGAGATRRAAASSSR